MTSRACLFLGIRCLRSAGDRYDLAGLRGWQVPFLSIPGAFDRQELEQTYKNYVNEIVSAVAPSPGVPLATVVAEGDPAESLITAAAGAELLVVGTRGRSPFAGLVLGSVSQRCAAASPGPVVLVKRAEEQSG